MTAIMFIGIPASGKSTFYRQHFFDTHNGDYSLVGCTVAPGFDFTDFEMGSREALLKRFPDHADIILRMCA